ncbi:MAG: PorT family protein [Treponema sp.]|jgi:hypothetical protein|nr:PorT family protein [Treponema sp.]
MVKILAMLTAVLVLNVGVVGAQEEDYSTDEEGIYIRLVAVPEVKVHVAPVDGGTPEERAYFKEQFEMEIMGASFQVVDRRTDSHYWMSLDITQLGDGEYPPNILSLALYNTDTGREVVSLSWGYETLDEMADWNLYLIYQAMANAPMIKMPNNAMLQGLFEGGLLGGDAGPPQGLFLGGRVGGLFSLHQFQMMGDYYGTTRSISGEAALFVEYQPFRHLGFKTEGMALYENFEGTRSSEPFRKKFSALSVKVPLLLKLPIDIGKVSLALFAGPYITFPLMMEEEGEKYDLKSNMFMPFGVSVGAEVGLSFKSTGKLVLGFRYDMDINTWRVGELGRGPYYVPMRFGLSLGWGWKVWEPKTDNAKADTERNRSTAPGDAVLDQEGDTVPDQEP